MRICRPKASARPPSGFRAIDNAYKTGKKGSSFRAYIDTRGKLAKQALPAAGHLVLHPASGSNAAAAVF